MCVYEAWAMRECRRRHRVVVLCGAPDAAEAAMSCAVGEAAGDDRAETHTWRSYLHVRFFATASSHCTALVGYAAQYLPYA